MIAVTHFSTGIPGMRAVVFCAESGKGRRILIIMVNILTNQVDIGTRVKYSGSIQTCPDGLRLATECITAGMTVGICHGHPGEEVQTVQFVFFIRTHLNVCVVVTEATTGRAGSAHDTGPCTGLAVDVPQVTHTFVQVVDLINEVTVPH